MTAKPVHVRTATLGDYDVLVALFDELDEFHRQGRPDFFQAFDGPARTRSRSSSGWPGRGRPCWWRSAARM
jgi:hypothetical protein